MNQYSITSPSLDGIISDDYIYFEGMHRPNAFFTVRDGGHTDEAQTVLLERYLEDVHNLFLRKLTQLLNEPLNDENTLKLQALLQEIIKVKGLIENASKVDIMRV